MYLYGFAISMGFRGGGINVFHFRILDLVLLQKFLRHANFALRCRRRLSIAQTMLEYSAIPS